MTTPDLKLRQRILGGQPVPPPQTGYRPLPGYSSSSSSPQAGIFGAAWASFQRSLLFRVYSDAYAWTKTTAAAPDTRIGRIAAWIEAFYNRSVLYRILIGGGVIGVCVAVGLWIQKGQSDLFVLAGRALAGAVIGPFYALFMSLLLYYFLRFITAYWKWAAGYAAFLILLMAISFFSEIN